MSGTHCFIGVGANLDPERHIREGLELLARKVRILGISTFYRTVPLGHPEQPFFINGVWQIQTEMTLRQVKFELLRQIEQQCGRRRDADRWAPRPLDLDLLLYGDRVADKPDLRLPAPDIRTRDFVCRPLLELAPDLSLPDTGERLCEVVQRCPASGQMEKLAAFTRALRQGFPVASADLYSGVSGSNGQEGSDRRS